MIGRTQISLGAIAIASVVLVGCSSPPGMEDLSQLEARAESAIKDLRQGESVSAAHEIGDDTNWLLIMVPANVTGQQLANAGVVGEIVQKLSDRPETWKKMSFVAYYEGSKVQYSEWPEFAGRITRPLITSGSHRTTVAVTITSTESGALVTGLEAK